MHIFTSTCGAKALHKGPQERKRKDIMLFLHVFIHVFYLCAQLSTYLSTSLFHLHRCNLFFLINSSLGDSNIRATRTCGHLLMKKRHYIRWRCAFFVAFCEGIIIVKFVKLFSCKNDRANVFNHAMKSCDT